jgi:hypothetical protein
MTPTETIPRSKEPQVGLEDRLYSLRESAGFLGTSRDEVNAAFGLLDEGSIVIATARHLNEIYRHQQKADTADPAAAVRSVTQQYVSYANKARHDYTFLQFLDANVHNPDLVNHRLSLDEIGAEDGVSQLTRFIDLSTYASRQTAEGMLLNPLEAEGRVIIGRKKTNAYDPYTTGAPTALGKERIDQVSDMPVVDAIKILPAALQDQKKRWEFWEIALKGANVYPHSRVIAKAALETLGASTKD